MAYGKYEQLIPLIDAYIAKNVNDPAGYSELCAVYNRLNDTNFAQINCKLAIKNNKYYARAHYDYSEVLKNLKQGRESEKELAQAKKLQPDIKSRAEVEEIMRSFKIEDNK